MRTSRMCGHAIKEMALSRYCHDDLLWHHVRRLGLKEHP
jgi:hypothetical protein